MCGDLKALPATETPPVAFGPEMMAPRIGVEEAEDEDDEEGDEAEEEGTCPPIEGP